MDEELLNHLARAICRTRIAKKLADGEYPANKSPFAVPFATMVDEQWPDWLDEARAVQVEMTHLGYSIARKNAPEATMKVATSAVRKMASRIIRKQKTQ